MIVLTNREKFKEVFQISQSQIDEGELYAYVWLPTHDAIEIPLEWWNAEYKEPVIRHDEVKGELNRVKNELVPTTKNNLGVDYTINGLDDFIEFGKRAFGVELTIKKSDNPDTYAKLFGTTKNDLGVDAVSRADAQTKIEMNASRYTIAKERGGIGQVEWSDQLIKVSDAVDIIRKLPPVTPQEPKSGRWITWKEAGNEIPSETRFECSVCHDAAQTLCNGLDLLSTFCPNCGCRMIEPQEVRNKE